MTPRSPDLRASEFAPDIDAVRRAQNDAFGEELRAMQRETQEGLLRLHRESQERVAHQKVEALKRGEVWKPPQPKPMELRPWESHYRSASYYPLGAGATSSPYGYR